MRGPTSSVEVDRVPGATLKPDHEKVTSTLACHACQLLGVENGRPQRRPRPSQAGAPHTSNATRRRGLKREMRAELRLVLL